MELAISASERAPSIALRRDGQVLIPSQCTRSAGALAAVVAAAFEEFGAHPKSLTEIRIDLGPGSYTGLRVAVTLARTLQRFADIPVHTCTSLQMLALAVLEQGLGADAPRLHPILDARRQRLHHAIIDATTLAAERAPAAELIEDVLNQIAAEEHIIAAEPLHEVLAPAVRESGARLHPAPSIHAELLFDPRLPMTPAAPEDLEPLYLMGSYAE